MSDISTTLGDIQRESDQHELRLVMKQMRDFLAGALCCACGEPLGHDDEIISDDDERTIHKRCEGHDDEAHD